ncbi:MULTISPECIES: hypothetical protein [Clostridium]|uniref:Uncharacterized protein n=1 Tax=Clostridium frigoriphilum TaxID=443253 RepID=A0ABU7URT5_9CLOT|nr:hypothetical protein [Clostridium sp. DSM 17811]
MENLKTEHPEVKRKVIETFAHKIIIYDFIITKLYGISAGR